MSEPVVIPEDETGFDRVLAFSIPSRDVRGRLVRLGPVLDTVLSAHEYPTAVRHMLAEADIQPNRPYKLTITDFELLAEAGAFQADERVELIDGKIIIMSPAYRRHHRAHTQLLVRLANAVDRLDRDLEVNSTPSVAIPPFSEPLPDIVVSARPKSRKGIELEVVRLIVEVSESTERYDLETKKALYAQAGVEEYWVVNTAKGWLRQFWSPAKGSYGESSETAFGSPVSARTIEGLVVDTHDFV